MEDLLFRELEPDDYHRGYIELMRANFPNYDYQVNYDNFGDYLIQTQNSVKIMVLYNQNQRRVIGAGTLFILPKIHNYSVGQIEDVVVDNQYRGLHLGQRIIEILVNIGMNDFHCYKIILNCLDENIGFYEKCGFDVVGSSMRYVQL